MSMHSSLSSRDNHVQVLAVITPHEDPRRQNEVLSSYTEVGDVVHVGDCCVANGCVHVCLVKRGWVWMGGGERSLRACVTPAVIPRFWRLQLGGPQALEPWCVVWVREGGTPWALLALPTP